MWDTYRAVALSKEFGYLWSSKGGGDDTGYGLDLSQDGNGEEVFQMLGVRESQGVREGLLQEERTADSISLRCCYWLCAWIHAPYIQPLYTGMDEGMDEKRGNIIWP